MKTPDKLNSSIFLAISQSRAGGEYGTKKSRMQAIADDKQNCSQPVGNISPDRREPASHVLGTLFPTGWETNQLSAAYRRGRSS